MNMDINTIIYSILFGSFLIYSCQSCADSCETQRKFTYEVTVFNLKDTFEIGEDIIFKLEVPDVIIEENTNEVMDISEWNYLTDLGLIEIINDSILVAYSTFNYIDSVGSFLIQKYDSTNWAVVLDFEKLEESREFVGKMSATKAGLYSFSIAHLITDIVLPDCPNRFVNLHYSLNDGANNNYHLIESEKVKAEFTEEEMRQFGGFVFVIKD